MKCKVCDSPTDLFGKAIILGKYSVSYHHCDGCGFLQTEPAYWLNEAYSKTITRSDIGLIGRNLQMAELTSKLLLTCFDPSGKFIDYGGGYGMFVRLMRDDGFDFYRHDPLCENLFSDGFDAQPGTSHTLLTAWEVFEHLSDPLAEIEKMLAFSRSLLFSTSLISSPPQPLNSWWYYGPEHGQHVAFYSVETLRFIAKTFNLRVVYSSRTFHLLSDADINPLLVRIALHRHLGVFGRLFAKPKPKSLLGKDYQQITGMNLR